MYRFANYASHATFFASQTSTTGITGVWGLDGPTGRFSLLANTQSQYRPASGTRGSHAPWSMLRPMVFMSLSA